MTEQQKTIDALWPVAEALAYHIQEWHVHQRGANHQQFGDPANGGWDNSRYAQAVFVKPGELTYRLRGGAEVILKNIDVAAPKPDDVYVGPIEPAGDQRVVKSEIISTLNDTLNDVDWKLTHRDLISTTTADKVAKEVGASLSVGLRQQIGYGSEIAQISGETEITVNMEASIRAAWEREMTSHRESEVTGERDILISALHRGRLEAGGDGGTGQAVDPGKRGAHLRRPPARPRPLLGRVGQPQRLHGHHPGLRGQALVQRGRLVSRPVQALPGHRPRQARPVPADRPRHGGEGARVRRGQPR